MKHRFTLFRALGSVLLASALLIGCDDDEGEDIVLPDGQVVYTDLDSDDDGLISDDEWDDYYDDWDLDGDGALEEDDWLLGADYGAVDVNGDGEIDDEEYDAAFDELDTDDDGYLDANELLFG